MLGAAILLRDLPDLPSAVQRKLASACAVEHGLGVGRVYHDDGRRIRAVREVVLRDAGEVFGTLVIGALPILGRNLREIVQFGSGLHRRGVRVLIAEGSADDAALLTTVTMLQEAQERLVREAIARGRERARARGVKFGRPPLPDSKTSRALAALAAGAGVRSAARTAGISPASVIRLRASLRG